MAKHAAIYIRVSTDAQYEEGYSVDAQKEMLEAFCVSKGIKKYKFYIDGGFTGSNIERPELQKIIDEAKQNKISHVIVYKLDRLSRSQKDTLYLIEDVFNPHKVDFISMQESMDTSTPLGRLMLGILSAFAQLERENIRERTRMGMTERVKEGYWMGGGRIPFGYDYDAEQGILVPNKDADRVRKIYELYIKGHSANRIAEMLDLKYEKLVTQILTRKSNIGVIIYNGEEYQGKHEPIISAEIYEEAMRCMKERSVTRPSETEHLLTGLVMCGKCGAKMRYCKWGKTGYKLVCYSQHASQKHLIRDAECSNVKVWATDLENLLHNELISLDIKFDEITNSKLTNKSLIDILTEQHLEHSNKLKKLYTLYSSTDDNDEFLISSINEEKKEINKLQLQLDAENEKIQSETKLSELKLTLSTLSDTWEHMPQRERKVFLRECINRIIILDNKIHIEYRIDVKNQ